jgi:hypothetical protein
LFFPPLLVANPARFRSARAMPDEADPPRKNYGFKEREFKRDNAPKSAEPPMPTAKELAIMAGPVAKHGQAARGSMNQDDPNDVYAILKANRAVEQKGGLNEVEIREIKSRRKRDYWLLLISSEVVLGVVAVLGRSNPFVLACSVAGMGLVAFGLTWIMWQVMNKY